MSIICLTMSIGSMSHVDFKKSSFRPAEFKGQRPHTWQACNRPLSTSPFNYLSIIRIHGVGGAFLSW